MGRVIKANMPESEAESDAGTFWRRERDCHVGGEFLQDACQRKRPCRACRKLFVPARAAVSAHYFKVQPLHPRKHDCLPVVTRRAKNVVAIFAQKRNRGAKEHDLLWGQDIKPDLQVPDLVRAQWKNLFPIAYAPPRIPSQHNPRQPTGVRLWR